MAVTPPLPPDFKRFFTLDEANLLVPRFTQIITDIQRLRQAILKVMEEKGEIAMGNGHVLHDIDQTQLDLRTVSQAVGRITELVDLINQTGAEMKDLDLGLIDFPHLRNGEAVYLCWIYGEVNVSHWHTLESGVSGRKPI